MWSFSLFTVLSLADEVQGQRYLTPVWCLEGEHLIQADCETAFIV